MPAAIRFLSVEPLLGPIPRLPLNRIDWVIVGGESGPDARPMMEEWVLKIPNQCLNRKRPIKFFFKQWGGVNKKQAGRKLKGAEWNDMPLPRPSRREAGLENGQTAIPLAAR